MTWKRVTTGVPAGSEPRPDPGERDRVAGDEQPDEQPDVGVGLPGGNGDAPITRSLASVEDVEASSRTIV